MLVVAGLSLKNLEPRVWDASSPYYLPRVRAVMVSYADFHQRPARRQAAMEQGLRRHLGVPRRVKIFLDNGAFYFAGRSGETPRHEYEEFVARAQPDWRPIPQDFIPLPDMAPAEQRQCFTRTMRINRAYHHDGFVPVIHASRLLPNYIAAIQAHPQLAAKSAIALGGLVPNLLRSPSALPYAEVLSGIRRARQVFADKTLHIFGVGGTATLHIAGLLGIDSADSSGWRNRAARGIIQLPGSGDRMVSELGSWRGRQPSPAEWKALRECSCPACRQFGVRGLRARRLHGFNNRATHNLWILTEEARWLEKQLARDSYPAAFRQRLNNSIYLPLIEQLIDIPLE